MQLYYYIDPEGNFGDDLNPRLWNQLIPDVLEQWPETLFVGIGTLLNSKVPATPPKIVFGAGVGYGTAPVLDATWQVYCVRGPLSAQALGLDPSLAITDPAILVRGIMPDLPAGLPRHAVSFMPHHGSKRHGDWRGICAQAGVHYIDPAGAIDDVLQAISHSDLLIAEAMHGAIVADALRVPWIPVVCYEHILPFKWLDWCGSLGLDYRPHRLPALFNVDRKIGPARYAKSALKRVLAHAGIAPRRWSPPIPRRSTAREIEAATAALAQLAAAGPARLSADNVHQRAIARLHDALARLRRDAAQGRPQLALSANASS